MRLSLIPLLSSLASLAFADVEFTVPAPGASVPGGGTLSVKWQESNTAPLITTFSSYQLFLMAGGNDDTSMIQLAAIGQGGAYPATSTSGVISAGLGGTGQNAYFLKMISVSKAGGQIINYSSRFTLTGMTGTFPATVLAGITANAGATAGPATENQLASSGGNGAAPAADAGEFTVPYNMQTGFIKYAPMQPVPPTKITAKTFKPLHPTSAFVLATTRLPIPSITLTVTASQTYSVSSMENTVAAASMPTGDMAKFLARWKD